MGSCFCVRVKAESPPHHAGSNSACAMDNSINLSSASVPPASRSRNEVLDSSNLKIFGFNELTMATENFRPDNLVGEGGFGLVFKGWIDEHTFKAAKPGIGTVVAIKSLNQTRIRDHNEWLTKMTNLGQLHHPNLVKLIGYCLENEQRMLVYEFMPKGNLDDHLFWSSVYFPPLLSWKLRMKIALGAAKGLVYLHSLEAKEFIYHNFKPSCILLDSNYNAKLSDFGLEKDAPMDGESHVVNRAVGAFDHSAPEYLSTGRRTAKSNVYSFGVVLLELLTGRRSRPPRKQNLIEWTKPYLTSRRSILHVMDARIEGQYSIAEAFKVATLGMQCLSYEREHRPKMEDVVKVLEDLQDVDL